MNKIQVGILGGAGYTGGELIRILLNHPHTEIGFVHSKSNVGRLLSDVHTDLAGETELHFTGEIGSADILFLCVGHGEATLLLKENPGLLDQKLIDLSQDHRLGKFVYGLPEINRNLVSKSDHVANPGCFATAIQLALLPMAVNKKLEGEIHVSATTGSTGAGQSLSTSSHFSWRQNNLSVYKAFKHQHMDEIDQTIHKLMPGSEHRINFIPLRGSFTRGIFGTAYFDCGMMLEEIAEHYKEYYKPHPFVHISSDPIDLKQVVNTNKCLLHLEKHDKKVLITFCIDNLLKGASGQAVQNMNLMFGLDEAAGLKLKASYF
ncbi:MAG: N-acetyl-gamma-glutamyl-phosphate reductase [Bacteroidia bacterium]